MSKYKIGDILKPTRDSTGYCQIYSIQDIPEHRLGYYSDDGSVKEIYHVYTDFGNTFPFTEEDIDDHYEVIKNEDVYERMKRWQGKVNKLVEWYEEEKLGSG